MTGRAQIVIQRRSDRELAIQWANRAAPGTRIEFKGPQRTVEQNDRMWAMLTDIARQKRLNGRRYSTDQWKVIFLHACGKEVQFVPSLDGSTFLPYGQSSSDLSVKEMSELIEFMFAWGAENGVAWSDPKQAEAQ
ncbi:recombination protein NinB [Bradyrhizobium sp. HKCCYLS3077]|uniref:recombination protein NinB n=1 Tax=Bradyrhizobium sp. HKCCYLS3077 TaxID=3420761 RepID=UPI003EC0425F